MNKRLKLISCYWDLIIYTMHSVEPQYKFFYRMMGNDLSRLLAMNFSVEEAKQLQTDVIELLSVYERMLPPKACTFQLHELVDLPSFIRLQ